MASSGIVFALDTATDVAVLGLVDRGSGDVILDAHAPPVALLAEAAGLFERAGVAPRDIDALVVGTGPGRYTSLRIGLATAKAVAAALALPVAGVSTLAALAAGAPGATALIDARRGEVFALDGSSNGSPASARPLCVRPEQVAVEGQVCVGDGAIAHRDALVARGADVPGDDDRRHRLAIDHLVAQAGAYGEPSDLEPLYLRVPDAERTRKEFPLA